MANKLDQQLRYPTQCVLATIERTEQFKSFSVVFPKKKQNFSLNAKIFVFHGATYLLRSIQLCPSLNLYSLVNNFKKMYVGEKQLLFLI